MKIERTFPPNYEDIKKHFPEVEGNSRVIFTYGETLYVPLTSAPIPDHLIVHEQTHTKQQGEDPKAWWDRYFIDIPFRLAQEIEAYKAQYVYYKSRIKDRNQQNRFIVDLAKMLSSPIYGNSITTSEAIKKLKE